MFLRDVIKKETPPVVFVTFSEANLAHTENHL